MFIILLGQVLPAIRFGTHDKTVHGFPNRANAYTSFASRQASHLLLNVFSGQDHKTIISQNIKDIRPSIGKRKDCQEKKMEKIKFILTLASNLTEPPKLDIDIQKRIWLLNNKGSKSL